MKKFPAVVLILSIVLAVQALTPEQHARVRQYNRECISTTGVDENLIRKGRQGEFSDDPNLKQFIFCFFKKVGFQNDNGDLQLDVIKRKISGDLNPEDVDKVIEACKGVKGGDPAETAFQVYKCYWNATPNHIALA